MTLPRVISIWVLGDVNGGFRTSLGPHISVRLFLSSKVAQMLITCFTFSPDHLFEGFMLQSSSVAAVSLNFSLCAAMISASSDLEGNYLPL